MTLVGLVTPREPLINLLLISSTIDSCFQVGIQCEYFVHSFLHYHQASNTLRSDHWQRLAIGRLDKTDCLTLNSESRIK